MEQGDWKSEYEKQNDAWRAGFRCRIEMEADEILSVNQKFLNDIRCEREWRNGFVSGKSWQKQQEPIEKQRITDESFEMGRQFERAKFGEPVAELDVFMNAKLGDDGRYHCRDCAFYVEDESCGCGGVKDGEVCTLDWPAKCPTPGRYKIYFVKEEE